MYNSNKNVQRLEAQLAVVASSVPRFLYCLGEVRRTEKSASGRPSRDLTLVCVRAVWAFVVCSTRWRQR